MIEVRVQLGAFDMTIRDILELEEGKTYGWQLEPTAALSLYVGEEKIADAQLVSEEDNLFVKITNIFNETSI